MGLENNNISVLFHWGGSVLAITIVALVIIIGTGIHLNAMDFPAIVLWLKYLLCGVLFVTVVIGVGYMPIRLKANSEAVTVTRLFGPLKVPMNEIIEVKRIPKSEIDKCIRTFGSGGLFGYLGKFKSDNLGHFTMYATDLSNLILITTPNKKYVFSCSRHKELIEYVNMRLK